MSLNMLRRLSTLATAVLIAAAALFLVIVVADHTPAVTSPTATRYVNGTSGSDTGDCIAAPCKTIGYALSQVSHHDAVYVAAGTYTESLTLNKPVNLMGADAGTTIIKAVSGRRVMTVTGATITNSTVISGFTFTGGNPENDIGGGLLVITSTPTIRNNHIISNYAGAGGGGLYILNSVGAILSGNIISGNTAATGRIGGGLFFNYSPSATVTGNSIVSNTAWRGGGLCLNHSPGATLFKNNIISNTAGFGPGMKFGGGLYVISSGNMTLNENTIRGNHAWDVGGGLYLSTCENVKFDRNNISHNIAGSGGGLSFGRGSTRMTNTVVVDNHGHIGSGLLIVASSARLLHTTIARNVGRESTGLHITDYALNVSNVMMTNTVLVSQTVGITVAANNTATLNGVLWYSNTNNYGGQGYITVTNEYTGNPAFDTDGYHLTASSASIDKGVSTEVDHDIDGDPRPMGHGYDLGADELRIELTVTKQADPDPVQAWSPLTYTIRVTNTGNVTLNATITDILPHWVTPSGVVTWRGVMIAPGGIWSEQAVVTPRPCYSGTLSNVVQVTTLAGATGVYTETSSVVFTGHCVYLPLAFKDSPPVTTTGRISITDIFYVGSDNAEPDEYVEIHNADDVHIQLHGWVLRDEANRTFTFPHYVMSPGQTCRVYTNEVHWDWCGFSFRSGSAIWDNGGDTAYLHNSSGMLIDTYTYPIPGLIIQGQVWLHNQGGPGLANVNVYRSYASYPGVVVATTDEEGYYQSDFAYVPGDEMVTVWAELAGYSFDPEQYYWRHYYGHESRTLNFIATPISATQ